MMSQTVGKDAIESWLVEKIAALVGTTADEVDLLEPLDNFGVDSAEAIIMAGELEEWLNVELPATVLSDFPTISSLAAYLCQLLAENRLRDSELYRKSLEYWMSRVPTLPPAPDLPLAKSPSALGSPRFVRRSGRLEHQRWRLLKTRGTRRGLTASSILLAAYAEILGTWSKSSRFTIYLRVVNRLPLQTQVNETVGDLTSLMPLAVEEPVSGNFEVRAKKIQEQLWEDLDHRYVSGVQVMLEQSRTTAQIVGGAMPAVFTSAVGLETTTGEFAHSLSEAKTVDGVSETPRAWFDHQVVEQGSELIFNWDVVDELFPSGVLDEMFEAYCSLLRRLSEEEEGGWGSAVNPTEEPLRKLRGRQETQVKSEDHRVEPDETEAAPEQHPSVREAAYQEASTPGSFPLTPSQRWFFEFAPKNPNRWNISVMLKTSKSIDADVMRSAMTELLRHHEVLRYHFHQDNSQFSQVVDQDQLQVNLTTFDFSGVREEEQESAMRGAMEAEQICLDIRYGPLIRVAIFRLGSRGDRLFVVVHHLVCDGVSLRILVDDLLSFYYQLLKGNQASVVRASDSYQTFASRLRDYVDTISARRELTYWLERLDRVTTRMSPEVTDPNPGENLEAGAKNCIVSLNKTETALVLRSTTKRLRAQVHELVLTTVVRALARWSRSAQITLDLVVHGREGLFNDLDFSRTVGWFATTFPATFDVDEREEFSSSLRKVQGELRQVPNKGIGYGALKYLSGSEGAKRLRHSPKPAVSFNYRGNFDALLMPSELAVERLDDTEDRDGEAESPWKILVLTQIFDGQLHVIWRYASKMFQPESIHLLASGGFEELRKVCSSDYVR
jgi:non-ribosomal peptide synthase protein (TIGR01720 family)